MTSRPLQMGRRGAVASQHPLATQAGLDVLRAGGHAVDAAVAVALASGVVEPHMSGLGGDGFYHVFDARTGGSTVFNGSGAAPMAASVERMRPHGPRISASSPCSIVTPAALAGIAGMHDAFGQLPWPRLVEPAIDLARHGFAVGHNYRLYAGFGRSRLRAHPRSAAIFLGGDGLPAHGAIVRQPDLAATLETIARDGAETFYRGSLAKRIADGIAGAGGIVTAADLAACRVDRQAPIAVAYRGFEVRQTPPNSIGFAMLQALKIVERFDLKAAGWGSAALIHLLVEAHKRASLDRDRFAGDPRWTVVPVEALLDAPAIDAHAAAIDPHAAMAMRGEQIAEEGDTSHFCVVDGQGSAVSGIQSISGSFGSGIVAGDTGVLLNSRMTHWNFDDGHPNRLEPGKRVRHTLTAPLVVRDGQLICVLGTPGGDAQGLIQIETLLAMIDFGFDPQRAVEEPRAAPLRIRGPDHPDLLGIERPIPPDVVAGLEQRGHEVKLLAPRGATGSMSVILRRPATGLLIAASDPRRDAWAAAY